MTVPRVWNGIEMQRSPEQQILIAEPNATDWRFRIAAFMLFVSWLVICFSLKHSLCHYKISNCALDHTCVRFTRNTPIKFMLIVPLALVVVGYEAVCAFDFSISPLKLGGSNAWIYGMGYTPIALIIFVQEVFGYVDPNEDRELIRQRRVREVAIDAEMRYTRKPRWWSRLHGDQEYSVSGTVSKSVREVTGRRDMAGVALATELYDIPTSPIQSGLGKGNITSKYGPHAGRNGASVLLSTPSSGAAERSDPFAGARDRRQVKDGIVTNHTTSDISERSNKTESGTTLTAPSQKIRSMLNV